MRLTTKSGSRSRPWSCGDQVRLAYGDHGSGQPDWRGARGTALPRPRGARAGGPAHLREQLAARRPRVAAPRARQLPHHELRLATRARGARRGGHDPRLPQRLSPSRLASAERLGRLRQGDPLPLPRLDLPPRRQPDRGARGAFDPGLDKSTLGLLPARRGDVRPGLRRPRPARTAPGRAGGRAAGAPGPLRDREPEALQPMGGQRALRTGRSWWRTTSRATTSRSPIPG